MWYPFSQSGRSSGLGFNPVVAGLLLAGGGAALAAAAQELVVKVERVAVQPRKTGIGKPLAVAHENERLTQLGPPEAGWLHVRTQDGIEGYVKEGSLTKLAFTTGGAT